MATHKKKTVKTPKSRSVSTDFWKVDFNVNSLFWIVIGLAVIATGVLTYNTYLQTNAIYDSIDQINIESEASAPKPKTSEPAN